MSPLLQNPTGPIYASELLQLQQQKQQQEQRIMMGEGGGIDSAAALAHQSYDGGGAGLSPTSTSTWVTRWILERIGMYLDDMGAWEWDLRYVAIGTAIVLYAIRRTCNKKCGIDWYAFVHAVVSASGALVCTYLDMYAFDSLQLIAVDGSTNTTTAASAAEPGMLLTSSSSFALRLCHCYGPLTSLHRILPAITLGYSLYDFVDGILISVDFALHGSATLFVMGFVCEMHLTQFMVPMLLMEVSTVFLTIVRADFFSTKMTIFNQLFFVVTFFLFRLVIVPYIWSIITITMYREQNNESYTSCIPSYLLPIWFVFGMFYNCLNAYWFYKIVKKVQRKISGIEHVSADNDIYDKEVVKGNSPSSSSSTSTTASSFATTTDMNGQDKLDCGKKSN